MESNLLSRFLVCPFSMRRIDTHMSPSKMHGFFLFQRSFCWNQQAVSVYLVQLGFLLTTVMIRCKPLKRSGSWFDKSVCSVSWKDLSLSSEPSMLIIFSLQVSTVFHVSRGVELPLTHGCKINLWVAFEKSSSWTLISGSHSNFLHAAGSSTLRLGSFFICISLATRWDLFFVSFESSSFSCEKQRGIF